MRALFCLAVRGVDGGPDDAAASVAMATGLPDGIILRLGKGTTASMPAIGRAPVLIRPRHDAEGLTTAVAAQPAAIVWDIRQGLSEVIALDAQLRALEALHGRAECATGIFAQFGAHPAAVLTLSTVSAGDDDPARHLHRLSGLIWRPAPGLGQAAQTTGRGLVLLAARALAVPAYDAGALSAPDAAIAAARAEGFDGCVTDDPNRLAAIKAA